MNDTQGTVISSNPARMFLGANDAFVGAFLNQIIDVEEINEASIKEGRFKSEFWELKRVLALTAGHWAKSEVLQRHGANIPRQKNYYAWRTGTVKFYFCIL